MTYSNARYPRDEFDFPPPPLWLTWVGRSRYLSPSEPTNEGVLRHHESLAKAKKHISGHASTYTQGLWYESWSIYRWDDSASKYVEEYSGEKGQVKAEHSLFRKRLKRDAGETHRKANDDDVQKALASILEDL